MKLDETGRKTRKVIIMDKELYPRSNVNRLNVSRTWGGRGLIGCKMCLKVDESSLVWYVKHYIEPWIVAARNCSIVTSENLTQPKELSDVNCHIDKSAESPLLRMPRVKNETLCE